MSGMAAEGVPTRRGPLGGGLLLLAVGVSLLFLYTGIEKASDIAGFERVVVSHGLLGAGAAGPAAIGLACAEVGVGVLGLALVMLRGPGSLPPVLMAESALFVVFAIYAALLVAQPPPEPTSCGCGFISAADADWPLILTRSVCAAAVLGAGSLLALRAGPRPMGTPTAL